VLEAPLLRPGAVSVVHRSDPAHRPRHRLELALRHVLLGEVDVLHLDAAFSEETLRGAGRLAPGKTKDLDHPSSWAQSMNLR
jgi:hypothetical protein